MVFSKCRQYKCPKLWKGTKDGSVQGFSWLPYEFPVVLAHLTPFCKFYPIFNHGAPIVSYPFELHVTLWSRMVSFAYAQCALLMPASWFTILKRSIPAKDQQYSMPLRKKFGSLSSDFDLLWGAIRESSMFKKSRNTIRQSLVDSISVSALHMSSNSSDASRRGMNSLLRLPWYCGFGLSGWKRMLPA